MCTVCGCSDGHPDPAHAAPGCDHHQGHDHHHEHHDHGHAHGPGDHHHHHHPAAEPGHQHAGDATRSTADTIDFGGGLAGVHVPGLTQARIVQIERDILGQNNSYAAANRARFAAAGSLVLNFVSSPGSGKTSLLVRSIEALKDKFALAVIEGDQQTANDAERVRATGVPAIQINTGKGCHLDAHMVGHALDRLAALPDLLLIENVGNLVCPAAFDLGEAHKVVVLSVTEGEDKPEKYPDMFAAADLMLINKIDLLPHLDFDLASCIERARRVNPRIAVLTLSARTGEGFPAFHAWIEKRAAAARAAGAAE